MKTRLTRRKRQVSYSMTTVVYICVCVSIYLIERNTHQMVNFKSKIITKHCHFIDASAAELKHILSSHPQMCASMMIHRHLAFNFL